jgi:hypothetical protein
VWFHPEYAAVALFGFGKALVAAAVRLPGAAKGVGLLTIQSRPFVKGTHAAPSSTFGPVGCGAPPIGSMVTAKAFAGVFTGTSAVHMLPHACPPGPSNPALIGAPCAGTSHIW